MKDIAAALDAGDADALKSLFSKAALVDKETYRIIYHYNIIDKKNPDKVGLSLLEVITDELYQEDDFVYIGE